MLFSVLLLMAVAGKISTEESDVENESSRKVLGSSVVTSVSVIMDTGNGSKAVFADAVGKPVLKPSASQLASPINLLNPDRYEFYTFDDNGELVKRLMTMEEIQGIIANGDGEGLTYNPEGLSAAENLVPEKKVDDVVSNVQNVLKGEMESHKNSDSKQPLFDTPDISSSWTMILPAIFGNSGEDIIPDKPPVFATPETIMIETSTPEISSSKQTTTTENVSTNELKNAVSSLPTTRKPVTSTIPYKTTIYKKPLSTVSKRNLTTTKAPYITKTTSYDAPALKDNSPQILLTSPSTKKPTSEKPQSFKIPISTQKTTKPVLQTEKPIKPVTLIPENKKTPPIFQTASSTTSTLSSIINLLTSDTQKLSSSTTNLWTTGSSSTPSPFIQATFSSKTTNKISENKFEKTTNAPAYSTSQPLISTFFEISDDKNQAPATESLQYQNSSSKTDITTQQYSTTNTPENTDLPLSTLGIQQNQADQKINENSSSTEPTKDNTMTETTNSNYYTVAQTSGIDKLAVTELLDQLLLTSTNIYQLNTELTDQTPEPPQEEIRFETGTEPSSTTLGIDTTKTPAETTTLAPKDVLKQSDSTTQANNLEQIMTEKSVVSSIEELLSQAIHDETEPAIIDNNESDRINQLISNLGDKPMSQAQSEAATVMSHLIGGPVDSPTLPTQTESVKNDSVFPTDETVLSESLGTLISQIVGSNIPSLSTTDYLPSTTHTLPNEDLSRTEQSDFSSLKITTEQILEPKTELYTPELTTDAKSATSEIVSTTIIPSNETANLSKPAKADLSFEVNFEDYQGKHGSAGIEKEDDTDTTTTVEYTTPEKENIAYTSAEPNVLSNKGTTENNLLASEDSTEAFSSTTAFDSVREESQTQALFFTTNRVALVTALLGNSTKTDTQTEPDLAIKKVTVKKEVPSSTPSIFTTTFEIQTKPSLNEKKDTETTWALVSTIPPRSTPSSSDLPLSTNAQTISSVELRPQSQQESGLEETTSGLDSDIYKFVELCNELSFGFWKTVSNGGISASRSLFVSPFAATSLLAMVFLGARGSTSGEMNEILKLDDMVTFNPHLIFRNVTESIEVSKKSGVAVSAIIRELYSDKSKGKLLNFYKERARQFYDGHVEEVNFKEIGDIIRRRTNLLVKRYTWGKISEYLKENTMSVRPPLAGVSVSIFQTDCSSASTENRDGELHFVVSPTIRQRRLVPIPAAVWRSDFLAGYEPGLDATAVAVGTNSQLISTIFVMPGQQGIAAPGDGLARLEKHLVDNAFTDGSWKRLLQSLIPRPGLEIQIPRFSHKSVINASFALQKMGLRDLFTSDKADLRGLNGVAHELYLSDMMQINNFATCGEGRIDETHHVEFYPTTSTRSFRRSRKLETDTTEVYESNGFEEAQDYQRAFHDPLLDAEYLSLPLPLRPRQARIPEAPRLRFDRPFLYFVRHNPTGLLLHMGRFNPRLLP